jgi:hypothetical protein
MKRTTKIAIPIGILLIGIPLFHLGPPTVSIGDDLVLARSTLTNGAQLFVVAHRTDTIFEPYEVTLYRVRPDGEIYLYWMGYEDSFWWRCSIRPDQDPTRLQIRAIGSVTAYYKIDDGSLTFPDDYYHYGVQTGRRGESNRVPSVIVKESIKKTQ